MRYTQEDLTHIEALADHIQILLLEGIHPQDVHIRTGADLRLVAHVDVKVAHKCKVSGLRSIDEGIVIRVFKMMKAGYSMGVIAASTGLRPVQVEHLWKRYYVWGMLRGYH